MPNIFETQIRIASIKKKKYFWDLDIDNVFQRNNNLLQI